MLLVSTFFPSVCILKKIGGKKRNGITVYLTLLTENPKLQHSVGSLYSLVYILTGILLYNRERGIDVLNSDKYFNKIGKIFLCKVTEGSVSIKCPIGLHRVSLGN